ncbi:Metallo-dependent phosphatase-like protein, partial [Blyttiomyces helicus]
SRIVAVGDLHGDLPHAVRVLMMAGISDDSGNWVGGQTTFVQTGDIVDRGPDTIVLYEMMQRLTSQAAEAGGKVVALLGNHEVMNMQDDLRYVTKEDFESFGGREKRKFAWSKEGWLGQYLRTLDIVAIVNETVFMHGGMHPKWAKKGIDWINAEAHRALTTLTPDQLWQFPLFGDDGPLWYRGYAQDAEEVICGVLQKALDHLKVRRMVIGHTPQYDGRILGRCTGKVFVIDVGISSVYGGHAAALEIVGDTVRALYPTKPALILADSVGDGV